MVVVAQGPLALSDRLSRRLASSSSSSSSLGTLLLLLFECVKDANLRIWIAEDIGIDIKWPLLINVDNKAGVS